MSIGEFIKDKTTVLLCNILMFIILSGIMLVINVNLVIIGFVFFIWFFPLLSYMVLEFVKYKKYFDEINDILENLDKKYLLPEMLKEATFAQGEKLNFILKEVSRDMHENVKYYKDMQSDYREYIETWVHEIKTPMASTKLIIENNQSEITNKIDFQLDRIDGFVEQVLYYSRSNTTHKDYIIKPINLHDAVMKVVKRNYRDFIHKKIKLNIKDINEIVYSDGKWTEFIINQIIGNSIKYLGNNEPLISISSIKKANSVILILEDNGIGIIDKDINRVFEKGFTGENGRKFSKSTGIGLYLCEKLCSKLGLKITLESEVDRGTKVLLMFPLSAMVTFNDD
ncbi:sensor histidine kinase [Clostridium saccharoperbutylacetonicum]|uniref:sensor histidine kinase n=1 Tax=Clostridium saccharoperbutylacetonicum TaxID=36745 RepID=UPI0009839A6D|nr:sensor histidine kinase [Clostridium saccharoperbutylacetonicum]AQR97254.1 sensor histidine kinase GraS [Clostridium saccharoperbutylacetonicum]NSB33136.1 signal transduction histidine kinase [Clostridium saccharoperbutylacetonicum]